MGIGELRGSTEEIIDSLREMTKPLTEPIDQTGESITLKLPDGTPVMELTAQHKGAWRDLPILYVGHSLHAPHVIEKIRAAQLPLIVIASPEELRGELQNRGMSEREIQEKITGLTHPMRSDAKLPSLAEVEYAMPVFKVNNPGKSSRRPALPKNRKRDRWT
ncbi:hypothetical protein [Burkholderia phage FLC9]|nr:hypothetical protein [Burkholderia phage FLC9]